MVILHFVNEFTDDLFELGNFGTFGGMLGKFGVLDVFFTDFAFEGVSVCHMNLLQKEKKKAY